MYNYKASSFVNLNYGLEIHILGFCVLHVKWNSLNDFNSPWKCDC